MSEEDGQVAKIRKRFNSNKKEAYEYKLQKKKKMQKLLYQFYKPSVVH